MIDDKLVELGDWRGETLSRMRKLIKEADPDIVEEWKWMGTPVWSHDWIICTGERGCKEFYVCEAYDNLSVILPRK